MQTHACVCVYVKIVCVCVSMCVYVYVCRSKMFCVVSVFVVCASICSRFIGAHSDAIACAPPCSSILLAADATACAATVALAVACPQWWTFGIDAAVSSTLAPSLTTCCAVAVCVSACDAVQWPALTALMGQSVLPEALDRVNGMLEAMEAVSELVTPVLAGAVIAGWGGGGVVVLDVTLFVVAAVAVTLTHRVVTPNTDTDTAATTQSRTDAVAAKEPFTALSDVAASVELRWCMAVAASGGVADAIADSLFVPMLSMVTRGDMAGTGALTTCIGVGMLAGGGVTAAWGCPRPLLTHAFRTGACVGVMLATAGAFPTLATVAGAGFVGCFFRAVQRACVETALQVHSPPGRLGRVAALRDVVASGAGMYV